QTERLESHGAEKGTLVRLTEHHRGGCRHAGDGEPTLRDAAADARSVGQAEFRCPLRSEPERVPDALWKHGIDRPGVDEETRAYRPSSSVAARDRAPDVDEAHTPRCPRKGVPMESLRQQHRGASTHGGFGAPGVTLDDVAQPRRVDRLLVDHVLEPCHAAALDDVVLVDVEGGHEYDG